MATSPRSVIGVISGTSMDAIDIAMLSTDGEHVTHAMGGMACPYPAALRARLQAVIADPAVAEHAPLAELEAAITDAFADAIEAFIRLKGLRADAIGMIGLHGQTIFHRPERGITRQLGDGQRLADRLGIDVVNRFRHADIAAGGQGAPLVPLYHAALASGLAKPLMVLNLGGVANVTYLDGDAILACDTGPASALIDDCMLRHFGRPYDEGGAVADRGRVDPGILAGLMDNPFFAAAPPKSLDRNDFHARARLVEGMLPEDGVATLTAFTVSATISILQHVPRAPQRWLVTGGGRHNLSLMRRFASALKVPVEPVEAVNWDGDLLEAQCFAYLAMRSIRGLPLSLPSTTGVPEPVSGGELWKPARPKA